MVGTKAITYGVDVPSCNAPRPTLQMRSMFCVSALLFICLLHSSLHHSHCIGTPLPSFFKNLHPLIVVASILSLLTFSQFNRATLFSLSSQPIKPLCLCDPLSDPSRVSEIARTRTAHSSPLHTDHPQISLNYLWFIY